MEHRFLLSDTMVAMLVMSFAAASSSSASRTIVAVINRA
jgi:hypothetical protein